MPAITHAEDADRYAYSALRSHIAQHDPMSTGHPGQLLGLAEAARVLPGYVGPVLTIRGIRGAAGWRVTRDPNLPSGAIRIRPALLTIYVREEGDLVLALALAEQRRQANRALRATVIAAAGRWFDDLRPFARPV